MNSEILLELTKIPGKWNKIEFFDLANITWERDIFLPAASVFKKLALIHKRNHKSHNEKLSFQEFVKIISHYQGTLHDAWDEQASFERNVIDGETSARHRTLDLLVEVLTLLEDANIPLDQKNQRIWKLIPSIRGRKLSDAYSKIDWNIAKTYISNLHDFLLVMDKSKSKIESKLASTTNGILADMGANFSDVDRDDLKMTYEKFFSDKEDAYISGLPQKLSFVENMIATLPELMNARDTFHKLNLPEDYLPAFEQKNISNEDVKTFAGQYIEAAEVAANAYENL